jgi:hypothetical protein
MTQRPLNIGFRQALTGARVGRWLHLCGPLIGVQLIENSDTFKWGLTKFGLFLVNSMYLGYMDDHTKFLKNNIWKIKVPLKIIIFMWFLHHKIPLRKDNLAKRKWQGCN